MKLVLSLILALSTTVLGQQAFGDKCTCHADNFMSELLDERRCLVKAENQGIENCLATDWDTTHGIKCTKCAPTHVIDEKLECVEHKLPQCIEAAINTGGGNNSKFPDYIKGFICTKCNDGYFINKDGWCTQNPTSINNCTVYEQHGAGKNDTRCHTCQESFWIQDDDKSACAPTPGSSDANYIANCVKYFNADGNNANWKCLECADTFWIQDDDGSDCAATPGSSDANYIANCEKYFNADGNNANWHCLECADTFWIQEDDGSECAATPGSSDANYIANCANYTNADGNDANWTCKDCEATFWIQEDDDSTCAPTPGSSDANYIANCEVYQNPDGNNANWLCPTCQDTYIKNTNETVCWATPISTTETATWTENCRTWTHPTTKYQCAECEGHNFLNTTGTNPKCDPVQRPVDHCTLYSNVLTCIKCEERYWLENGICVQCPAEKYVAPVPVTCPSAPGNTPTGPTGPNDPVNPANPTNSTNSNSIILQCGLVLALSLLLL